MNFRFFDIGLREIINEPGNEFEFYRSMVTTYINASADSSQSQGWVFSKERDLGSKQTTAK